MTWKIPENHFDLGLLFDVVVAYGIMSECARAYAVNHFHGTIGRQINHEYNDMVAIVKIKRNKYTDNVFINKLLLG